MIRINQVDQRYGGTQILWGLNLDIAEGSCTCIMGRNGVGKTTLLKTLMGLLPISAGEILLQGQALHTQTAEQRAPLGIGYVPQGREIFPLLTVEENLRLGLPVRTDKAKDIPDKIFELFPVLHDMLARRGGDLSGGQQQQLAIGRALVIDPKVLILDEPNEGIQPNIIQQIGRVIAQLRARGDMAIVLVEQYFDFARELGDQFLVLERGAEKLRGRADEIERDVLLAAVSV